MVADSRTRWGKGAPELLIVTTKPPAGAGAVSWIDTDVCKFIPTRVSCILIDGATTVTVLRSPVEGVLNPCGMLSVNCV